MCFLLLPHPEELAQIKIKLFAQYNQFSKSEGYLRVSHSKGDRQNKLWSVLPEAGLNYSYLIVVVYLHQPV